MNTAKLIEYPHYKNLPKELSHNLNIMRTYIFNGEGLECYDVDENDLEFLTLEQLVVWLKSELPEYDADFVKAAARVHKECYDEGIFDYFAVDEEDLFNELLYIKDEYGMKLASTNLN